MNLIRRLDISTVGPEITVSGVAAYRSRSRLSDPAGRLPAALEFDLQLADRTDLRTLALLLTAPHPGRVLTCHGTVWSGGDRAMIVALRSRHSTITPPGVEPYDGAVWLEYVDDAPRPDDVSVDNCYAAAMLDLSRGDATQVALRLLDAASATSARDE